MRFRGWSSLVISACSALVLAGSASAHISVDPKRVAAGSPADLVFAAANESIEGGATRVTIEVPDGFGLDDAEAKPGWTQARSGSTITWSGGRIPHDQFETFELRGDTPAATGPLRFRVTVADDAGHSTAYTVPVDVVSSVTTDSGAHTLGKVALGIALGAALLAFAGFFGVLYLWLRPGPTA